MRPFIAFLLLALASVCVQSQCIYLNNVDALAYPTIRADYVAVDANGHPYTTLTEADFRVTDQLGTGRTVDVTASVSHGCRYATSDSPASIILIVDESLSMEKHLNLVKDILRAFVQQLNFATGTQVCIVGFAADSRIVCPWTSSTALLIDSINAITPRGSTNYEVSFTSQTNIFDEFRKRDFSIPKAVIFLSDDHPFPPIINPPAFVETVCKEAHEQSIVIHSISFDEDTTEPALAQICKRTGGTSQVGSGDMLASLFEGAARAVSTRGTCYIEWISPYGCDVSDHERTDVVTLLRGRKPSDTTSYTLKLESNALVTSSTSLLELGSPSANSYLDASVTFTVANVDLKVRDHVISPSTHFTVIDWDYPNGVVTQPSAYNILTFSKDVPRVVRIRLTQGSTSAVHTAVLSLIGDPCTITQALRGGGTHVVVVTPNGSEVLTTCDTVDIRWSGVPVDAPVFIQWSTDGGTWNDIATAATGLTYRWLPIVKGLTYRIRITYAPPAEYTWMQQIGHTGSDTSSSVAIRPAGDKVYITGWFRDTTQFGQSPISYPQGATDGFCQEFDNEGLWGRTFLLTGESGKNEKVIGAVTDDKGNLYIAGSFESITARLTGGTINVPLRMPEGQFGSVQDASNMFLAKIAPTGVIDWVRRGQGTFKDATHANATCVGIMKNAKRQTQIVVGGTFVNFINVGTSKSGLQMQLGPGIKSGPYYATYDEFGNAIELSASTPPTTYRYASRTTTDSSGCTFEVNHFKGTVTKGPFSFTARNNNTDVFLARKCVVPVVIDESDATFIVGTPHLRMVDTTLLVNPAAVGSSTANTFAQRICNIDICPVRIEDATLSGLHAGDFSLSTPIAGRIVQPNECFDLDIQFRPLAQGTRTATLNIVGDCGVLLAPMLVGEGIVPKDTAVSIEDVDWFTRLVGTVHDSVMYLTNTGTQDLTLESLAVGAVSGDITADFTQLPSMPLLLLAGAALPIPIQFAPTLHGSHSMEVVANISGISTRVKGLARGFCVTPATLIIDPLEFSPTLSCDITIASFWIKNPSTTNALVVTDFVESDVSNVFDLLGQAPITIAPADSVEIFIRFSPREAQVYSATFNFTNGSIPGLYVNATGEGITTNLVAYIEPLPDADVSAIVNIPITIHPAAPYFSGLSTVKVELVYPEQALNFVGTPGALTSATITAIDSSITGRLSYTIDVVGPFTQDLLLTSVFRTLLSADTIVNITANLSTEYTCVHTTPADDAFTVALSCAGNRRLVNLGANTFALAQPYPSPATDKLTIRYSTGYLAPALFNVIDAIGNVVSSVTLGEQASAEYEVDVPLHTLAGGTYVLRMTSGHFVASRIFSVVR